MNEDFEKMIHDYITKNLKIYVEQSYVNYKKVTKFSLYLKDKLISSDYVHNKDIY